MSSFTTPLFISLTFATAFGVLFHDTQVDKAATAAFVAPVAAASFAIVNLSNKLDDHVHVEKASPADQAGALRGNIAKAPPRTDDRRYIQSKKIFFGGSNNSGLWPSV